MATHHLGPESPHPFAVLSEDFASKGQLSIPQFPQYDRYSFGRDYEKKLCALIHFHLELDVDDNICYVGHTEGSLVEVLAEQYCLLKPITTVVPGHIHCQETPSHKMVPVKIPGVGAEEYFREQVENNQEPQFDKILFKDAIPYLTHPQITYVNAMKTLKPGGKLLIVHRSAPLNTLPLFSNAHDRFRQIDQAYLKIIDELQSLHYDVTWEIEVVPTTMTKMKWYSMLQNKFPPQMEIISNHEIRMGIRELSEGILKYNGDMVEFHDRLLFISAPKAEILLGYPIVQRQPPKSKAKPKSNKSDLKLHMEIPDDLEPYIRDKIRREKSQNEKH